jgi:hypothetical protein
MATSDMIASLFNNTFIVFDKVVVRDVLFIGCACKLYTHMICKNAAALDGAIHALGPPFFIIIAKVTAFRLNCSCAYRDRTGIKKFYIFSRFPL